MVNHSLWSRCLWTSSLRFMARHRWQTGLSFLGIALGVAIVVAVDLANQSARKAFALSLSTLTGPISHQIVGPARGIDEQLFVRLRTELGMNRSAPLLQTRVKIRQQAFTLLGIDPISELSLSRHQGAFSGKPLNELLQLPDGIAMAQQTAQGLQLGIGDSFAIQYRDKNLIVQLAALFDAGEQPALAGLLFTDIAIAQQLFGRQGWLDRIDIDVPAERLAALRQWLPRPYLLLESDKRNQSLLAMSSAFHSNLTAMSLLALLVGALLIYNTMSFSALRRRAVIGTYRALGVTRGELFSLLLSEAFVLALIASLVGVLLGWLLSHQLVQLMTRTINDLYFVLTVKQFLLSPGSLLKGFSLGIGMTLVATALPAWAATKVPPITLQRRSETERRWRHYYSLLAVAGCCLLILGYVFSSVPSAFVIGGLVTDLAVTGGSVTAYSLTGSSVTDGFVALSMIAFGFCLMAPLALIVLCRLLLLLTAPLLGIAGRLAIRGISASISRTGIAVAALAVAIATWVGVSIMIGSFRHSVDLWLQQSLSGDIYLSIPGSSNQNHSDGIPDTLIRQLVDIEGIRRIATLRSWRNETEFGRFRTLNIDPMDRQKHQLLLSQVTDFENRFRAGQGVLVSEPLAYHQGLAVGDSIQLQTDEGERDFVILGVFRDYSSSLGVISLPTSLLKKHWSTAPAINAVVLYLDSPDAAVIPQIQELMKGYPGHYDLLANRQIRERSLRIFDRTFAITGVLRVLVLIVAFTGLLSALLALQLEKSREYAVLRAMGFTHQQMSLLILGQSTLLGLLAALLSLPLGVLLANRLIEVVNRRSFGWSMEQIFPLELLPQTLLLAAVTAVLAGCYPAWKMRRTAIAHALREE